MRVFSAVLLASLSAAAALAALSPAGAGATAQPGRITVIGDSILTAVEWYSQPRSVLEQGFADVDLQIAVCRTLTGPSCPFEGERPQNLVDLVQSLGPGIGSTVVVEVGYNDPEEGFADAVDQSVHALLAAGVRRILWVNYHDWVQPYGQLNAILAQTVAKYPQVTIVDWQADSLNRYSWFQSDGVHLVTAGAMALASLIHDALVSALAAPASTAPLIVAHAPTVTVTQVGTRFSAQLGVTGGKGPFRWRVTRGRLARGLHLLPNGVISGTPTTPGRMTVELVVSDASGESAGLRLVLTIRPR